MRYIQLFRKCEMRYHACKICKLTIIIGIFVRFLRLSVARLGPTLQAGKRQLLIDLSHQPFKA